jgi:hypothetical protein
MNKCMILFLLVLLCSCEPKTDQSGSSDSRVLKCLEAKLQFKTYPPASLKQLLDRTKLYSDCKANQKELEQYTNSIIKNDPAFIERLY